MGELFDRTMASAAQYRLEPAIAAYDFSRVRLIVDVGGGNGALMFAILKRYPDAQGVVFDLPLVAERARQSLQASEIRTRCSVVAGNALDSVPRGADCYLLSNFLVSMDDARATAILRNCRQAMVSGGTVLLIEWVIPASSTSVDPFTFWDTASMDFNMFAIDGRAGWHVRTAREFQILLEESGFVSSRIIPTRSTVSLIEARTE